MKNYLSDCSITDWIGHSALVNPGDNEEDDLMNEGTSKPISSRDLPNSPKRINRTVSPDDGDDKSDRKFPRTRQEISVTLDRMFKKERIRF